MSIYSNYSTSQPSMVMIGDEMDTRADRVAATNKRNSSHVETESRKKVRPNENSESSSEQNEPFDLNEYFEYINHSNTQLGLHSLINSAKNRNYEFFLPSQPSLNQLLHDHRETFCDYQTQLESNWQARLTARPNSTTAYDGAEGARRVQYRLRNLGYTHFNVDLNFNGANHCSRYQFRSRAR